MGFQPLKRDVNPQSYRWCFMWNKYDETENWREVIEKELQKFVCMYYIFGEEKAPTTGMHHLQGYFRSARIIYKNTLTNSVIKWHVDQLFFMNLNTSIIYVIVCSFIIIAPKYSPFEFCFWKKNMQFF